MEMLFTHVQLQDFPVLKIIEWLKWKKSFFLNIDVNTWLFKTLSMLFTHVHSVYMLCVAYDMGFFKS